MPWHPSWSVKYFLSRPIRNLWRHQPRKLLQRLLPAEGAHLGGDRLGDVGQDDKELGAALHLVGR